MSLNQTMAESSKSSQYRKSGRSRSSSQSRNCSSGSGKGGGAAPQPSSSSISSSIPSSRSYRKSNNTREGRSRVSSVNANFDSNNVAAVRTQQNGFHLQTAPLHEAADNPVSDFSAKPTSDMSTQRSTRAVPKVPASKPAVASSDSTVPAAFAKGQSPGEASRPFPLQFGSINVSFGMQIPARTSSASPNLDEQQWDQARHDSLRAGSTFPIPSVLKQQMSRKDGGAGDQFNTGEAHQSLKAKRDLQFSSTSPVTRASKASVHPIAGVSLPMPCHQPQVPVRFSGANPQIPSQGMAATSLPMHRSMPLSRGNAPQLPQPVFVPGMQPHQMQPAGLMCQAQSLNFTPQMGPQLPSQLGNMGISIEPQFPQQQARTFGGTCKPVNITHPDTYDELRLDKMADAYADGGSSGPRSHSDAQKSQPITSVPPGHPINYFHNSYNPNPPIFAASNSVPLNNNQINPTSREQRFSYPIGQGTQAVSFMNPPVHNTYSSKNSSPMQCITESSSLEHSQYVHSSIASSASVSVQLTIKPAVGLHAEKLADSVLAVSSSAVEKDGSPGLTQQPGEANSNHLQKVSETCLESSSTQPAPGPTSSSLPASGIQSTIVRPFSVDGTLTNSSSSVPPATLEESIPVVTAGSENRRETVSRSNSRESFSIPIKIINRPSRGPRLDCHGSATGDDDQWSKLPGSLSATRDPWMDSCGSHFQHGHGGNDGVLRNPHMHATKKKKKNATKKKKKNARMQIPAQYAVGILSGPMQSKGSQGGTARNGPDSDRWQQASAFQKGLIPSPQIPLQLMQKTEKKYEVGKVTDEEHAKQRQLKAILNKLTPQNFEKLFEQVKAVNIDNAETLAGAVSQIFDRALMEPTFSKMYADFCVHLARELPNFNEDNEKITFKRLLLNKCQEEFERGEREQEEAERPDEEGEVKQSEEEREEKRIKARRRMLGNIRLIGELYKKKMLTEKIMHECIMKLLGQYQNPDEENIEALCKLMSTIGEIIDHPKAKGHMDAYFDMMAKLSNNMKLSSRVRFMLKDAIDLRKNNWQQRRKVEGPKKIEEVHRDAAQERQVQAGRLARGPSMNSSARNRQAMDFGPRGSSMLSSSSSQMGNFRGPTPVRGYGAQDVRLDESRHSFDSRTPSLPLPQRSGEDSITLGPQGGLAKGMSGRGQPSMPNNSLAEVPGPGDSRRTISGLNGYGSVSDRTVYGSREDFIPRYTDRLLGPFDQPGMQDRNVYYGNRDPRNPDRSLDRSQPASPIVCNQGSTDVQDVSSDKVWPEERLRDMSLDAIKEFYSVKDEKEVTLCIKDLNSPSFYPEMISIWVTDSFERKETERDLLSKLLINLSRPCDGMLNQDHLVKGFVSVLAGLEDAVNDAPKAGEYLGQMFAKIILEKVIPFSEIGQLIYEGGQEKGSLVEAGLAAEVVGIILETIKSENSEPVLNEILMSSSLKLEKFRPSDSNRPLRLDKFFRG